MSLNCTNKKKSKAGDGVKAFNKLHALIKKSGAKPYEAYIEMKYGAQAMDLDYFKNKVIADMRAFSKSMIKRRKLVRYGGSLDCEYVGYIKATDHWIDYLNDWCRNDDESEVTAFGKGNVHKGKSKRKNKGA